MATPNSQQKSFLASLFDFGFTSFVTLRFLKVIYAIITVLVLLGGLALLIAGFSTGTAAGIIGAIIFAPLITLVYLVLARITFEVIAMFFRIGDNTFLAVQLLGGGKPGQWGAGQQPGFGGPPPYGAPGVPAPPWAQGPGSSDPAAGQPPYGQPQPNYGQPQPPKYQPPQERSQGQHGQPSDPPSSSPGQPGWGPSGPPQQ